MDRSGDLLGLSLTQAVINEDASMLELHLALIGLSEEESPEVLGVVRTLSNALATTLTLNLGKEGALRQVALWRSAMRAQAAEETS